MPTISLCACPLPSAFNDISNQSCPVKIDLVNRIAFQRLSTGSLFDSGVNAITAEASWDTFLAASDATKIQFTPKFANTTTGASEPITFGGDDNTTSDGEQLIVGETTPTFEAFFYNLDPAIKAEIGSLSCENDLGVWLIDAVGNVIGLSDGGTDTTPIPVKSLFIGTRSLGGRTEPDQTKIQFNFLPDWDAQLVKTNITTFDITTKQN